MGKVKIVTRNKQDIETIQRETVKKKLKIIRKQQTEDTQEEKIFTPSHLNLPVFVMSLPIHAKFLPNNAWMEELIQENSEEIQINIERFVYEWFTIYNCLTNEGIVLTFPSVPKLQDLHYINSFVYLPHIKEPKTCIIARFRAEGRQQEEQVAYDFLTKCGYTCHQPPFGLYFEGEPELRYLREDMYIGSYGVRGTRAALEWIESNFNCKVFKLGIETDKLFHGDCICFPITPFDVLVGVNHVDKSELRELEKVANIIPIEDEGLLLNGIMNNISVGYTVYVGDYSLAFRDKKDLLEIEKKKKDVISNIANNLGLEVVFISLTQSLLQGACLSCLVARLNYIDKFQMVAWKEGINSLAVELIDETTLSKQVEILNEELEWF